MTILDEEVQLQFTCLPAYDLTWTFEHVFAPPGLTLEGTTLSMYVAWTLTRVWIFLPQHASNGARISFLRVP